MFNEIFLDAPNIGEGEKKYVNIALETGYVSTVGSFVGQFEERFATYLAARKAVSTQSGTAAIHMALHELGIGEGDEVIVPALTFVATVNPVIYVGAKPIFADVDIKTWNISSLEIEKKITDKTKAIIPVHLYGNPCRMDEIMRIAQKHGLCVIEDATESLGAMYAGKHTGTFGDMGCFSFNGNKIITTGGGGMVVSQDDGKMEHIKFLVNQARNELLGYYHPEVGFNYRMTNIEAALGLAQMKKLDEFLEKKKTFNAIYREEFENIKGVHFQDEYENARSSYWMSCIIFEKDIDMPFFQEELNKRGIVTRRVFMPVVEFPPYQDHRRDDYENSYRIYEKGLCLPGSTLNSIKSIHYVCEKIKELL